MNKKNMSWQKTEEKNIRKLLNFARGNYLPSLLVRLIEVCKIE